MIPFSPPNITEEAINEVVDTLRSGWITTGPKTKKFEDKLTHFCGNKKTICVSSATAGLELILRWFGVKEGDEVIVPAYTYCASANVIVHCGAKPVLVDINEDDFNINIKKAEEKITDKTKVIIPVDIGGLPCDYNKLNSLVKKYEKLFRAENEIQRKLGRILILSDSAHSLGAYYENKRTGSLTDVSVFSFHAVKNLTTAEGGAIALNLSEQFDCEQIYKKLNVISLHGQNKDALAKSRKGGWRYDVTENGYKANMTDIQASLGLVELKYYSDKTLKRRREIIEMYQNAFKNYKWAQLPEIENEKRTSSFHLYMLRIKNITENQRDEIMEQIFAQDVSVNVHFQPLPLLTAFKKLGFDISNYPISFDNYSREISLPVYYNLTNDNVKKVIDSVVNAVQKIIKC